MPHKPANMPHKQVNQPHKRANRKSSTASRVRRSVSCHGPTRGGGNPPPPRRAPRAPRRRAHRPFERADAVRPALARPWPSPRRDLAGSGSLVKYWSNTARRAAARARDPPPQPTDSQGPSRGPGKARLEHRVSRGPGFSAPAASRAARLQRAQDHEGMRTREAAEFSIAVSVSFHDPARPPERRTLVGGKPARPRQPWAANRRPTPRAPATGALEEMRPGPGPAV